VAVKGGVDGTRIVEECSITITVTPVTTPICPVRTFRIVGKKYVLALLGVRRSVGLTFPSKGEGHTAATLAAPSLITSLRVL
jgi:hypothetical protein